MNESCISLIRWSRASALFGLLLLCGVLNISASIEVQNPIHAGFTVTADEEKVQVKVPSGSTTTILDETYPEGAHPGPILCSWDPDTRDPASYRGGEGTVAVPHDRRGFLHSEAVVSARLTLES